MRSLHRRLDRLEMALPAPPGQCSDLAAVDAAVRELEELVRQYPGGLPKGDTEVARRVVCILSFCSEQDGKEFYSRVSLPALEFASAVLDKIMFEVQDDGER